MKKLWLLIFPLVTLAQEASVDKSNFNVQAGTFGIWANNESRLGQQVALRSEIGLDSGIFLGGLYEGIGFFMVPVLTAEPRWYYNLEKRAAKSRTTAQNSANYLSLKLSYHPDWLVVSNKENLDVVNQVSAVPTWGIRRASGHFNYETGFGIGYRYLFGDQAGLSSTEGEVAVNLHLRLGYSF